VFPYRRSGEDPIRMFAGEGTPERTNRRFHLLAHGQPAVRLSTAFDSVTLYGEDPHTRPDIYGKVGNSGVSIATLDDMKKLYSGFDLCAPNTSVSMTINGPAPMILAFFMNAAIDQQVELYLKGNDLWDEAEQRIKEHFKGSMQPQYHAEMPPGNNGLGLAMLGITSDRLIGIKGFDQKHYEQIRRQTLGTVRGTVQADILKEDQAQNTCIAADHHAARSRHDEDHVAHQPVHRYAPRRAQLGAVAAVDRIYSGHGPSIADESAPTIAAEAALTGAWTAALQISARRLYSMSLHVGGKLPSISPVGLGLNPGEYHASFSCIGSE
jgi:methylmalonyl-CoA mutase N-terminal domain/subunit